MTGVANVWTAGLIGASGSPPDVHAGRPLLETVAFDVVSVDLQMVTGEFLQAVVVIVATSSASSPP